MRTNVRLVPEAYLRKRKVGAPGERRPSFYLPYSQTLVTAAPGIWADLPPPRDLKICRTSFTLLRTRRCSVLMVLSVPGPFP